MSSKSRPKPPVLYLDRNFGSKIVPKLLRDAGIECEIHDNHLNQAAEDQEWIRLCARKGWLAITQDAQIKYNQPIKDAILASNCGIVVVTASNITGEQTGQLIISNIDKIFRFYGRTKRPFVARLSKGGDLSVLKLK